MLPTSAVLPSSETESIKGRLEVQIHMNKTTHIMKMGLIIKACINNTCLFSRKVFDGTEVPGKKNVYFLIFVKKQPEFPLDTWMKGVEIFSTIEQINATVSKKQNVIAETKWRKLRSFSLEVPDRVQTSTYQSWHFLKKSLLCTMNSFKLWHSSSSRTC